MIQKSINSLQDPLGPIEEKSAYIPFDQTDYYFKEFGSPLVRCFIFFRHLIPQERIISVKHLAWKIEKEFSLNGKRLVNIDPGYLLLERLVLVTFKNYSHRIYLGQGVYGEVTLIYRQGRFEPLPWTYPDYAEERIREIFKKARERYRQKLRHVT